MATPHKELLLKLGLKKFGGQILKWQEFWATIRKSTLLQPVEKFSFFKSRVGKQSFGINRMTRTTNVNYEVTVNMLKERFGNKQLTVDLY